MASALNSTQADLHHDGDVAKDWTATEEALSRLAQEAAGSACDRRTLMAGSDISAGLRISEPSLDATLRPADLKNERFPSERPSLGRRASRAVVRLVIAVFVGVAATLAWQSYGEAGKQMIASWAQQLGWPLLMPVTNPPPSRRSVAEQPSLPAVQASAPETSEASPVAQSAPSAVAPSARATPSPDLQPLEAMARDLAAVRQNVDQLAVSQEQMARDIATLKTSALPPKPTAAPARKPVPNPASQAAPKIIAAPALPPPMPPPPQTAPQISPAAPSPGPPLVQPAPEISVAPPGPPPPSRPPMPVPN